MLQLMLQHIKLTQLIIFISLKKLINSYDNRYDAMIQTGDKVNADSNIRPEI